MTGRDLGSFVAEAQTALERVTIPSGYWTAWGGTFEQLESASKRLQIVVPLALLMVFVLLFTMFGNIKDGLLEFTGSPFALTGGILSSTALTLLVLLVLYRLAHRRRRDKDELPERALAKAVV